MPADDDAAAGARGAADPAPAGLSTPPGELDGAWLVVGLRVAQFAIDLLIVAVLALLPMSVLLVLPRNPDGTLAALLVAIPVVLAALAGSVALSWWYLAAWPARRGGQTLGMRWLRLRVVDLAGRPATGLAMGLRWVMLLVDGLALGAVGLAAMLLTPRHQRLGDVLAETVVVRVPAPGRSARG